MQVARFYYLLETGQIVEGKLQQEMKAMLGDPGIKHKFVKGVEGRDVQVYRKSGTWGDFHADSGIFVRDNLTYILVAVRQNRPEAGSDVLTGIRIVDDLMLERAARRKPDAGG